MRSYPLTERKSVDVGIFACSDKQKGGLTKARRRLHSRASPAALLLLLRLCNLRKRLVR